MDSNQKIKVVVADDHDLYRDGLKMLLNQEPEIEIVGEAADGNKLVERVKETKPDVVLTDLRMPGIDGIQAIREIFEAGLSANCIAISTYDSDQLIVDALEAGAKGYIVKNAKNGEIVEAVKTVYAGDPYYCKSTGLKLARKISKSKFNPYDKMQRDLFSEQEKEIMRLVCREKTSEEIGDLLSMSPRTVERIRSKIMEKAGVKSTIGLVIYAIKNGIFFIEELN
ncbi:response regulator [Parafilimonas sp.]|uniref:response regulator n=1 Tax=Parafilimonas sp. TaxID=1969739 RepID=UPI0039E2CE0A